MTPYGVETPPNLKTNETEASGQPNSIQDVAEHACDGVETDLSCLLICRPSPHRSLFMCSRHLNTTHSHRHRARQPWSRFLGVQSGSGKAARYLMAVMLGIYP